MDNRVGAGGIGPNYPLGEPVQSSEEGRRRSAELNRSGPLANLQSPNANASARSARFAHHGHRATSAAGPIAMQNVVAYNDGSTVGEIDTKSDSARTILHDFLENHLDPQCLEDRFGAGYPPEVFDPAVYSGILVAVKNGKIAGFMDFGPTGYHDDKLVADVNVVVDKAHHGGGLARNLTRQVDGVMRGKGIKYKFGYVLEEHVTQLERLTSRGWKIDDELSIPGDMTAVWSALDSAYADIPPPRLPEA